MTDREKQIAEMARLICDFRYNVEEFSTCDECQEAKQDKFFKDKFICPMMKKARQLYNAGYRKMNDTVVVLKTPDISPEELEHIKTKLYNDSAVLLPVVPETIDIEKACKQAVNEFCEKLKSFIIAHTCVSDKDVNTIYHGIDMLYAELYEKDTNNV